MHILINLHENIMEKLTVKEFFADLNDNELKKEIFKLKTVRQIFKFLKLELYELDPSFRFQIDVDIDTKLAEEVRDIVKNQELREETQLRRSGEFNRKELKSSEDFEGFKYLLFKVEGFKDCLSNEVIKELFDFKEKCEK